MAIAAVRMLRDNLIEVLDSEYVRMAELKGLPSRAVLLRHALPNALVPTLNVTAINLGYLIGGVVIVEKVFSYPGFRRAACRFAPISRHSADRGDGDHRGSGLCRGQSARRSRRHTAQSAGCEAVEGGSLMVMASTQGRYPGRHCADLATIADEPADRRGHPAHSFHHCRAPGLSGHPMAHRRSAPGRRFPE